MCFRRQVRFHMLEVIRIAEMLLVGSVRWEHSDACLVRHYNQSNLLLFRDDLHEGLAQLPSRNSLSPLEMDAGSREERTHTRHSMLTNQPAGLDSGPSAFRSVATTLASGLCIIVAPRKSPIKNFAFYLGA